MKFLRTPKELKFAVNEVNIILELEGKAALETTVVSFKKGEGMSLTADGDNVTIGYERITDATRALSMLERFVSGDKLPVEQKAKYEILCPMVDCSRNAVLNMDAAKEFMVHLAIMGFNGMMLYTEDTYEIPEYPYFGHLRGKFTVEELKELDAYGEKMGIEVIPCIQTLAHLNAITDWSCFRPYIDVSDILLADDVRTYALIEAMFKTLRSCLKSKHINIGMDEAHMLGRGKHTDIHGPEAKPDIMIRHLAKVVELCKKYDFEPVMWSDMFFRMQFDGRYRISPDKGMLAKDVTDKIPEEVALCYWEYYTNPNMIEDTEHMFRCHEAAGREIWFAGGAWSWSGFCPKNQFSLWVTPNQLELAEKYGVKNVIATMWGDDGAECPAFGMLPSLLQYAELCYDKADDKTMNERSKDCFGLSLDDFVKVGCVGHYGDFTKDATHPTTFEKPALYNDPMMGIMNWDLDRADLAGKYKKDAKKLEPLTENERFGYLFDTQYRLALVLQHKTYLSRNIKDAYKEGDKLALQKIVDHDIPTVYELLDDFITAFRFQWHWINKPFGWEVQDLRLGGLKQRLITTSERLQQYIDGEIDVLDELEQPDLPLACRESLTKTNNIWRRAATRAVVGHN